MVTVSLSSSAIGQSDKEAISKYLPVHMAKVKSVTGISKDEIIVKKLTDFSGNEFELIETGSSGYYIFDPYSGRYLEYSKDAPSPYFDKFGDLIYFGPKQYYVGNDRKYFHTIIAGEKDFSEEDLYVLQNSFDEMIGQSRETKDNRVLDFINESYSEKSTLESFEFKSITPIYISDYTYIRDDPYPPNQGDTCGYVGACLVLNYWNKRTPSAGVIPSVYLQANGNLKITGDTLQDKLLSYGYSRTTWGLTIRDVFYDYCTEYGIGATMSYYLLAYSVYSELLADRPAILFGPLPDPSSDSKVNHAVTAYGYQIESDLYYFIVHYGWSGYNEIVLDPNFVASNTQFQLN